MDCRPIDLQDYAYGFLEEEAAARVREHVDACGRCRTGLERLIAEKALLGRAVAAPISRSRAAGTLIPLAFAAALIVGLLGLLMPRTPAPAGIVGIPAGQDKKAREAPPDEAGLKAEVGRLKQAIDKTTDPEERTRIQAAIDNLQVEIARVREGKAERNPAPEMKEKAGKKGSARIDELTKAIEKTPNDGAAYAARGEEYLNTKRWVQAAEDARKAIELQPADARAFWVLGRACRLLQLADESEKAFARAVQLDPKLAAEIELYKRTAKTQEDLNALYGKMKATADPDERAGLEMHARELDRELKLLSQGDRTMANIKDIEQRLQANPNDAVALADRAAWNLDHGKPEPALQDLDRAIELKPDFALAYLKRAVAHAMKGDSDRAWKDAKRGETLDPRNMKVVEQTYIAIKKFYVVHKDSQRSRTEIEQEIAALKDRLEELRSMASNAELPVPSQQRAAKELPRVQAELDRLAAELKSRPLESENPAKKVDKKK